MLKLAHPLAPRPLHSALLLALLLIPTIAFTETSRHRYHTPKQPWLAPIVHSFVKTPFGATSCKNVDTHRGVDIVTIKETGVVAPADGLVIVAATKDQFFPGLNNLIVIDHGDDTTTVYADLGVQLVNSGEWVRRGQRIAMTQAPSATKTQSQTHVELHHQGKAIDPFQRLPYVFFDLQLPAPSNFPSPSIH